MLEACTYNECENERANSVADVRRNVISELLYGRQEPLQFVELSLRGARVAAACRRRRHGRRGGAVARRPGLASRGAR